MPSPPVILGYHGIADIDVGHDPVRLFVSPARFRRQVKSLLRRRYRFLTVADFVAEQSAGKDLTRTCVLTFDDGSSDMFTNLLPILEELDVPGTVYVCPGLLGEPYPWLAPEAGVRFLTKPELLELATSPLVEIGSHTVKHTELDQASAEMAYEEMIRSKSMLEDMLGAEVPSFCYPRCHYSPTCPDAARRAGHTSAVTCGVRGSWDPFELKRESFHRNDGPVTFGLKSRSLYYGIRDNPAARAVRVATRPLRHLR